jgi:hypothetical protein
VNTRFALLAALACLGCGPALDVPSDTNDASSTGDVDDASTTSSSSSSSSSTSSDDGSSGDTTGTPEPPCEPDWPDDGSEVIEVVAQSVVTDWIHNDQYDLDYHMFFTDESPIPGTQAVGIAANDDDLVVSPYHWGPTVGGMDATPFRGARVRMRAMVAMRGVEGSASLWMRIDGDPEPALALDNPDNHPDSGTSLDWEQHEIVMDVPEEATWLAFGTLIVGPGVIVAGNPTFEIVTDDVPTTSPNRRPPSGAITCGMPTDDRVEEVLHYTHADIWYDLLNEDPVPFLTLARDDAMTYDGVPALHVELDGSAEIGDSPLLWWPGSAARRIRLTLPVRANFDGELRLAMNVYEGETVTTRHTDPIDVEAGAWTLHTVVTEVGEGPTISFAAGIEAAGVGDFWIGYGVVEHVADDVPLSPLVE